MFKTALLTTLAALALAQAAQAGPAAPDGVPGTLAPPEGSKLFLIAHAVGVQIYDCTATGTAHEWRLVAPRADLYGPSGGKIGTHSGGPTWQAADGSTVKAARAAGAKVDPTAVDWLLLAATSATAGPDGDRFAHTNAIQRIHTVGGLAPAASTCTAMTAGARAEIPYEADYAFYKQPEA